MIGTVSGTLARASLMVAISESNSPHSTLALESK